MFDVAPGKLRDMYQPIDTFQVYKSAEINDVGDGAGDQVPNIHAVKDLLTETTPLLFQNRAATQHNVIAETVQLNDPAAQRLTHKVFQVRHTADVTSEAGRKPLTPRSRIRPPFTTSITLPSMVLPSSAASSILRHARSNLARFLERIRRPSASSLVIT